MSSCAEERTDVKWRCLTGAFAGGVSGVAVVALLLTASQAAAQEPQPAAPPDTAAAERPAISQESRPDSVRGDTLKSPLPVGEVPPLPAIGPEYRWRGDEILSSGALTLLDLLEQLPEISGYRAGWLLPPEYATVAGSFRGVRVFLDGVELDALDPRQEGLHDLGMIQLWPLEEVAVDDRKSVV